MLSENMPSQRDTRHNRQREAHQRPETERYNGRVNSCV